MSNIMSGIILTEVFYVVLFVQMTETIILGENTVF